MTELPFVSVAAIDGICVGGGAELALWCDRRLISDNPKAQFGFPEVKLGMFPGWGGTARTPRIVGLSNAVEMVTGGESIDARAAVAMGLASDVPASRPAARSGHATRPRRAANRPYLEDRQRWALPIDIDETELMFLGATARPISSSRPRGIIRRRSRPWN